MDPSIAITEHPMIFEKTTGDTFVPLELKEGAWVMADTQSSQHNLPFSDATPLLAAESKLRALPSLHFVPYYFRANRGGKGHMRVGLRKWLKE